MGQLQDPGHDPNNLQGLKLAVIHYESSSLHNSEFYCLTIASMEPLIDFGSKDVPRSSRQGLVNGIFTRIAGCYDLMNDIMSFGLHRRWKNSLASLIVSDLLISHADKSAPCRMIDMAAGTGDVGLRVARAMEKEQIKGEVVLCDICQAMLKVASRRASAVKTRGIDISVVEGNAEVLDYPDGSFHSYSIAFGIRNVNDRPKALQEAVRVLQPGGKIYVLEFSRVQNPILSCIYDLYSYWVLPSLGGIIAKDSSSYRYLVESIRKFPDQEAFAATMRDAGFDEVGYRNILWGAVAVHQGTVKKS